MSKRTRRFTDRVAVPAATTRRAYWAGSGCPPEDCGREGPVEELEYGGRALRELAMPLPERPARAVPRCRACGKPSERAHPGWEATASAAGPAGGVVDDRQDRQAELRGDREHLVGAPPIEPAPLGFHLGPVQVFTNGLGSRAQGTGGLPAQRLPSVETKAGVLPDDPARRGVCQ